MTRRGRARLGAILVVVAVAPWVGSCGKDSYASYCDAVKGHREALSKIEQRDSPSTLDALPILRDLRDRAPDDVRTDWNQVVSAFERLQRAFDEADIDPSTYDPAHPPPGLTAGQKAAIDAAVAGVTSSDTERAWLAVQQEARDVCHTPLTL